jgi:hypothetical protein
MGQTSSEKSFKKSQKKICAMQKLKGNLPGSIA